MSYKKRRRESCIEQVLFLTLSVSAPTFLTAPMGNCLGSSAVGSLTTSEMGNNKSKSKSISHKPEDGSASASASSKSANGKRNGKIMDTPNLKMFTSSELRSATRNFRPDTVLGEGGFGTVFKGWLDDKTLAPSKVGVGIAIAVKKSSSDSAQGMQEWQAEVKFLGKFSHPNLVRLLGYCWEDKDFYLVYEYMQKGSLENHLFRKGAETLSWEIRLKVAIGAARGLDHLHTSEKSVIYRDFKASNILLDTAFNAKLSDFGLAKLGPANGFSHVTTRIMGTYGYAAPEYIATGHLYVKSDVYGFGVVLLELLTGLPALDNNRPTNEHNLVEWAKPSLSEKRKLKKIMDPRLEGHYPIKAASHAGELILKCIQSDPKNRPSMAQVLEDLEKINAIKQKPKEASKVASDNNRRRQEEQSRRHQRSPLRSPLHQKHGGVNAAPNPRGRPYY